MLAQMVTSLLWALLQLFECERMAVNILSEAADLSRVNSHNEWSSLREVVLGTPTGLVEYHLDVFIPAVLFR